MLKIIARVLSVCTFLLAAIVVGFGQTPALKVNNASGSGDITDFQAGATNKIQIDLAGDIKLDGSNTGFSGAQGDGSSLGTGLAGFDLFFPTSTCWKEIIGTGSSAGLTAATSATTNSLPKWTGGGLARALTVIETKGCPGLVDPLFGATGRGSSSVTAIPGAGSVSSSPCLGTEVISAGPAGGPPLVLTFL